MKPPSKNREAILNCLVKIGSGNYEQIAIALQWKDIAQVARRLSELRRSGNIIEDGVAKTSRGRNAIVYKVCDNPVPIDEKIKKRQYVKYHRPTPLINNPLFIK